MNYGKYFQLNLEESKVVNGVTIYDYLDLPAYFGSPNSLSPKYPLSVTITSDSVRFCLHYCAYKLDDGSYTYHIDGLPQNVSEPETIHLQEMILELYYSDNSMQSVSTAIKQVYKTVFPSATDNPFMDKLLEKRYAHSEGNSSDIETDMYRRLQEDNDHDRSFSNLWLMGIRKSNSGQKPRIDLKDPSGKIYVAFLRKVLLDFMFDLKHSEVFQSSVHYQEMYSGLMADYFFSALMDKCEYYYCRGLTLDAISEYENQKMDSTKKENKATRERISVLYAGKLYEAEKKWVSDIMNPLSAKHFQHETDMFSAHNNLHEMIKNWFSKNLFEPLHNGIFITRDSWFADPEEELRRVCFTMKEEENKKSHICNSETVAECLKIHDRKGISDLRMKISRWFLRRNAFLDVVHLHMFKGAHLFIPLIIAFVTGCMIFSNSILSQDFWRNNSFIWITFFLFWIVGFGIAIFLCLFSKSRKASALESVLMVYRKRLIGKRMIWWMMAFGCFICLFYSASHSNPQYNDCIKYALHAALICAFLLIALSPVAHIRPFLNVHLLLPRLIASIAAAWLTLAIGNELFSSFFDVVPSWLSCVFLSTIVLLFLAYEMNVIVPGESVLVKFLRSGEVLILSYALSFIVGLFVINFTGERFLERSGYLDTFYRDYITADRPLNTEMDNGIQYQFDGTVEEGFTNRELLKGLDSLRVYKNKGVSSPVGRIPVVSYWRIGKYDFFILRDFLIQFAFLAMFIGVFIQMLFEEKSITEM